MPPGKRSSIACATGFHEKSGSTRTCARTMMGISATLPAPSAVTNAGACRRHAVAASTTPSAVSPTPTGLTRAVSGDARSSQYALSIILSARPSNETPPMGMRTATAASHRHAWGPARPGHRRSMPHAASNATAGNAGSEYCSSRAGVAEKNAITAASQVHAKPLAAPASGTRRIHGMLRSRNLAQNSSSGSPRSRAAASSPRRRGRAG